MRRLLATCFGLACVVVGCAVDGTETSSSEDALSANVKGNAQGWAYLRYEPSGPAFDYVKGGTQIQVNGKWEHKSKYVCAKAPGKPWGWILVDGEITGLQWSKVPSGKGSCERGDVGETSIVYWSCHVRDAATLRYQASPAGEGYESLAAGQAISLPTADHCDAPPVVNGMVWIAAGPQADGNNCRAPGGNDKGWVLASDIECTDPSSGAVAGVTGCAASDGCHGKYANAPFTAADSLTPLYRYFNAPGVDHFITVDRNDTGYAGFGYGFEGTEGRIYRDKVPNSVPLFRLFNPGIVDHFYTTSSSERAFAESSGYTFERVEGYVFDAQQAGTVPLYRYWNAVGGDHLETITRNDAGYVNYGYSYEGVTGWVFPD